MILDQDKPIIEPKFDIAYQIDYLEGGAPIMVDSSIIPGIQLADFSAWSITRYIRKRHKWNDSIKKPFDKISAEFLAGMNGKIEHVLNS